MIITGEYAAEETAVLVTDVYNAVEVERTDAAKMRQ